MRHRPTKEQFNRQLEQMVLALRNEIINGVYAPGDCLPSEKDLVKRFGMSNNSIRTGLAQLVREGWIDKVPRVGNRVAAGRPPVKLKLLSNSLPFRNLKLQQLLDGFHRQYPWIQVETVKVVGIDGFFEQTGGIAGDLLLLENNQYWQMAGRGMSRHLEKLEEKPELYPQVTKLFETDEGLYLQPLIFSPIVLCYNRAHFRECGLLEPDGSWTWDELLRNAEKLSDGKNRYGFCFHIPSENRWPVFLLQSMERFEWDGSGLRDIRGTKMLESMKIVKSILHNRKALPLYLSEDNDDIDRMFMEGKVSMTLNSYIGLNGWSESDIEYDISPIPFIHESRTLAIALGVGVSRNTKHREEAMLLVDYLTSEEAQSFIRSHTMSIPSLGTLPIHIEKTALYRPSRYMMFREVMASLRKIADLNLPYGMIRALSNQLRAYWADLIDEDELCDRLIQVLSKQPEKEK
ncbi:extracellular solute-binding protein [Paenibacillus mesophilus]|uniref:extracellular solute-binding protein n=1 Tax=Paenibacillus mesophilus TaxID=2582849 RepID=UPI00110EB801|nr:extracellular solute-binding protein [Paenibacillus mesophilus]TMV47544.1 extracellular solute-binding protein [Paenibacillus mesophilus]